MRKIILRFAGVVYFAFSFCYFLKHDMRFDKGINVDGWDFIHLHWADKILAIFASPVHAALNLARVIIKWLVMRMEDLVEVYDPEVVLAATFFLLFLVILIRSWWRNSANRENNN